MGIFLMHIIREGLKKSLKLQMSEQRGGGGVQEIPPVSEPIFKNDFISKWF